MDEFQPPPDDALDETIEESFPASDAPANTVETGLAIDDDVAEDAPAEDAPQE